MISIFWTKYVDISPLHKKIVHQFFGPFCQQSSRIESNFFRAATYLICSSQATSSLQQEFPSLKKGLAKVAAAVPVAIINCIPKGYKRAFFGRKSIMHEGFFFPVRPKGSNDATTWLHDESDICKHFGDSGTPRPPKMIDRISINFQQQLINLLLSLDYESDYASQKMLQGPTVLNGHLCHGLLLSQ